MIRFFSLLNNAFALKKTSLKNDITKLFHHSTQDFHYLWTCLLQLANLMEKPVQVQAIAMYISSTSMTPYPWKPWVAKNHYIEFSPYQPKCPTIPVCSSRARCSTQTQSLHFQNVTEAAARDVTNFRAERESRQRTCEECSAPPHPHRVALGRHRAHSFPGFGLKVFTFPKVGFHQMTRVF